MLNATFSHISAISRRPVLVVEEVEYTERTTDHGQATGKLCHLWLRVECTLFVIYKAVREPTPNQIKSLATIVDSLGHVFFTKILAFCW
jgi:hypothetical protein